MRIRKVIDVKTYWGLTGYEMYDLALECGHHTTAIKRTRGSRVEKLPPKKKRCYRCEAGDPG